MGSHRVLRHAHFSFVRFVLQGVGLRDAWQRCLAFAGGVDDIRHIDHRLREICEQIQVGAQACGAASLGRTALDALARRRLAEASAAAHRDAAAAGLPHRTDALDVAAAGGEVVEISRASAAAVLASAPLPTLDDWVQARCDELNIDMDFQSQADWLVEYQAEFGAQLLAPPAPASPSTPATTGTMAVLEPVPVGALHDRDEGSKSLRDQVSALNGLATLLAVAPSLEDAISAWLSDALVDRLRAVGIVTLANLAGFIDVYGFRWHVRIEGLGAVRAARLVAWLVPILDKLGRPLREASQRPARHLAIARDQRLAALDPARIERFAIVPLERLAVPPELSGRSGTFRVNGPNTFGVDDDLSAVRCWLRRYEASPRTYRSYLHGVEIFVLWAIWARRKPISSLVEDDLHAFRGFLAAPPADWIQSRQVDRSDDAWRPLRGRLEPRSQRHVFSVVGSLYTGLMQAGYLSVHAAAGVAAHLKLPRAVINIRRRFSDAQWSHLQAVLADLPDSASTRRLRLVLELGATTGLRLSEMCTARMGMLRAESVPSETLGHPDTQAWILTVIGKGAKERDVLIFEDVKGLIDRHQVDLAALERKIDARAPVRSLAPADPAAPAAAGVGEAGPTSVGPVAPAVEISADLRPLVGALRPPVPRWQRSNLGVATLVQDVPPSDAHGALDPSALYQALKRLFARAAVSEIAGVGQGAASFDREAFNQASTHWLRHFFGSTAAHDQVALPVLRDQLGHASLNTTSIYAQQEQSALVTQMAKLRRRS
jgi:site-specific recombinase XerD